VGKSRPDSRAVKVSIVRVKAKPRGRSFEPGNGFGAEHRFKKGMPSANPSGRPLCKEVNAASREYLGSETDKSPKARTNAQAIVAAQGKKARKGDLGAAQFLADRAEGRPAVSVHTDAGGDGLALILAQMNDMSQEIGPPEGFVPRQRVLEARNGDE
jgi:hypothetical protein